MTRFIARRLLHAAAVIFAVVTLTFVVTRLAPGDPFANGFSIPLPPEFLEDHRAFWGLDRPIWDQYVTFVNNLAHGDLGRSFHSRRPVTEQLGGAIINSLLLGLAALVINFALGVTGGAWQATRHGSRTDHALSIAGLALLSIPVFWLGILSAVVFGNMLGWFPTSGAYTTTAYAGLGFMGKILDRTHHLVLPAATLGLVGAAWTARYMRAQTLDVLTLPHVRTARAKGLETFTVLSRHVARNALMPIVTLFGMYVPALLSGAVFVEYAFAWHGLGWEAASAVAQNDYPVIVATALITATMVVLGNLVADVLYRIVDPRVGSA